MFTETAEDFIAQRIRSDRDFFNRFHPDRDKKEFRQAWTEYQALGGRRVMTYEPHYEGSWVIAGPSGGVCSAHGSHELRATPGHHLPPRDLSFGRNVFEELGAYLTLIALDARDSDVKAFEAAARRRNVPLKITRDSFKGGREAYEARLILVRPDQYVAWVGDTAPDDTVALIGKITGWSS